MKKEFYYRAKYKHRRKLLFLCLVILLCFGTSNTFAQITTIDFENMGLSEGAKPAHPWTYDGFIFDLGAGDVGTSGFTFYAGNGEGGTNSMTVEYGNKTVTELIITKSGGGEFAFHGIWLKKYFGSDTVNIQGWLGDSRIGNQLNFNIATGNTFTASPAWNVDKIVIRGNIDLDFDNFQYGDPISPNTIPTISINDNTLSYTENNAATLIDATASVNDSDGDADWNGGGLTVQVTANSESADEISISDTDGDGTAITISGTNLLANGTDIGDLTASGGVVTGGTMLSIVFDSDATNANVQEVLQSLRYRNTSDDPGTANKTITINATDKNAANSSDTRTISIIAVNDEPVLISTGLNPTFTEGESAVSLFQSTSASTVESGQTFSDLTMTVSNVNNGSNERLNVDGTTIVLTNGTSGTTASNSLSYSVSVSGTTATVSLSGGTMSTSALKTLVDASTYQNNSNDPTTSNRVVSITSLADSGGTANGGDDTAELAIASTVTVLSTNDEPALTSTGNNPTFTEGGSAADLFSSTLVSTVESGQTLSSFTMTVSKVNDGSNERLNLDGTTIVLTHGTSGTTASNSLSYSVSVSGTTATVSLSGGTMSTSALQTLVDAITYQNNSKDPTTSNRVVSITSLADSGGTANGGDDIATLAIASTVTVLSTNDEPALTSTGNNPTFTEGGSAADLFSSTAATTLESGQTLTGFTMTVSNVNDGSNERLNVDGTSIVLTHGTSGTTAASSLSYNVSMSGTTATVSFGGGTMSTSALQSLVDAITYQNNSNAPTTTNRVVSITSLMDSGGTANGGDDTAALSVVSTVTVVAVNDKPTGANFTANSIYKGTSYVFSTSDFGFTDIDGDIMTKIAVNLVPHEGILYVDADNDDDYDAGEELADADNVTKADLDNGNLQYYNDTGINSYFEFAVYDGTAYSASTYTATLNIIAFPTVTTQAVSSITATTATGNGNINDLGIPNPTAHGVCWSTSENPTTAGSKDDKGAATATGAFTCDITGLSAGTTYYARAFASNSAGTVYGSQVSFTSNTPPTVSNRTFSNVHKGIVYTRFGYLYNDYVDTDEIVHILITSLPANGTLFMDNNQNSKLDSEEEVSVNDQVARDYLILGFLQYLNTDGTSSSFTYKASDGADYSNTATVNLTVNPTPTVTFTSEAESYSEATTEIRITAQLSEVMNYAGVTVPYSVDESSTATGGDTDYSIWESPISISAGSNSSTILITVSNDALDEGDETVVVNMGTPKNADQGAITQHTVTITDDDPTPTVEFNTTSSEGLESVSSANLQVNLSAQSGLPVSVNYAVSGTATRTGADCTLADGTLNFAAGETSKNITISSIVSNLLDEDDETVIVSLSSPSNAGLGDNTAHTYTILDDDPTPTVEFASTSSNGLESVSSADLQVDLSAESGMDVSVDYTVTGTATGADFTLANGNLTIAAGTTTNNITIASIVNDFLIEDNETVVVTLSNPGNATLVGNTVHTYTITDDDTAGFTIVESDESTSVTEPNTTDTYTVVLDAQPISNVVLNVVSSDTGEATVDKASLTFTNGNWNIPQTVTVTAADDDLIDGDQSTTITLSVDVASSDDTFDALADQVVYVTTTDNNVAGFTISESDGNTSIAESGLEDSFTVVLDAQPISDVVLNISDGSTDEATIDKTTLTFTSGNWNSPQTVTITPVDDDFDDGDQPITLIISIDADGSDNDFDPVADQTVSVTSTDDDTAGFTLTKTNTSVAESGTSDSFIVALDAKPSSNVVLNVASGDESEVTVSSATFTFTAENWNVGQTVNLTGIDDDFADGNKTTTITISVDDANSDDVFDPVVNQTVSCITSDDEEVGFTLWENDAYTAVKESGTTDVFTVVLDGPPASDVVLNVVSGDTGEVTVDKASLTFTNSNWNSAQIVTVTGVDDVAGDGTQTTDIRISVDDARSDDAFDALEDQIIKTTTIDDDAPGITVIETNRSTIGWEAGKIDTIWVNLNSMPTSDVVFSFARANSEEIDIEFLEYQFEVTEWDEPRAFRIAGVNDNVVDGDVTVPLTISVVDEKSDIAYRDFADIVINAINIDNEVASFSVWKTTALVDETGTSDSFTVKLDAKPLSDVVFNVSSGDTDEATVDRSTLTFTPDDWNSAQTVNVTGVNDDLADGSQTTDITISVNAASSQDLFDDLEDQTVSVTTTDDDANFTLSKTTASVDESGTTDEFTVVLNGAPSSDVVLSLTSGDTGESTVDQATLTFTSENWNSPQTVIITGVDDNLIDGNQSSLITIGVVDGSSDHAFSYAADQNITCSTNDDDVKPIVVENQSFTIDENTINTSIVGTVNATDGNEGTIFSQWKIISGNEKGIFMINSDSGTITVTNSTNLDYETSTILILAITVSDGDNTSDPVNVTVNVNDLNDNTPVIAASQTFSIDENLENETVVGTILASDEDAGTTFSAWTIVSGNTNNAFTINASTGQLTVNDQSQLDFESTTSYKLSITVSDGVNTSLAENVRVNINDLNDNQPVIVSNQTFDVDENTSNATSLGTVLASDEDAGTSFSQWLIVGGNDDGIFAINTTSGVISIADNTNLDFEQTESYALSITVSDGVNTSQVENVRIDINDLNDNTPVIASNQTFDVDENKDNNAVVGTVLASDEDAGTSFSQWLIVGGNDDGIFAINTTSGVISIADNTNLDFEQTESYALSIIVSDGVNTSQVENVRIDINDLNDNIPVVTANQTFNVDENKANNTIIGTVMATDNDAGTSFSAWKITDGNTDGIFELNASSGEISIADNTNLDYETTTSYTLSLTVSDGTNISASETINIDVNPINDITPVITCCQGFNLVENVDNGTKVGTVSVSDADTGDDEFYTDWTIVSGNEDGIFKIDENSGEITVFDNTYLDYERNGSHNLILTVSDGLHTSAEENVQIQMYDENDNAPVIANGQSFNVDENASNSTSVGTVSATDADLNTHYTDWTITGGNTDGIFAINAASGEISIADNTNLDFEQTESYTLSITVSDGSNTSLAENVRIDINDLNDNIPVVTANQTFNVDENKANNTIIGTVMATDNDAGTSFSAWKITAGNTDGIFELNASSGEISIADNTNLDYETTTSYTLSLTVSDGANISASETINIDVNPINDNDPIVTVSQSFSAIEHASNGTVIGTILATDNDVPTTFSTWQIIDGNADGIFTIDPDNGELKVAKSELLDHETLTSHTLSVTVSDGVNTSAAEQVIINIENVNDHSPVIDEGQTFTVSEDATNFTVVGTVTASDADAGTTFTNWTIFGSTDADHIFSLDSETGEITVQDNTHLDYEYKTEYLLQIMVSDGEETSAYGNVYINITNVNEHTPVITPNQSFTIHENLHNGNGFAVISAIDKDHDAELTNWKIIGGNELNAFRLNSDDGYLYVNNSSLLDREKVEFFEITLSTSDGEHTSEPEVIKILLEDLNDNRPVIATNQSFSLDENPEENEIIGKILVSDADVSPTTYRNWMITNMLDFDNNGNNAIKIDQDNGNLLVNDPADFDCETNASFTIKVKVSDGTDFGAEETITISLKDINEYAPVVTENQEFNIKEDASENTAIGVLSATDKDIETSLSQWTITDGNEADLFMIDPSSGEITLANNENLDFEASQVHILSVTVSDGMYSSEQQNVSINVIDVNEAPVAKVGDDQMVAGNVLVTLDGSNSTDPENDELTYHWTAPEGITLSDVNSAQPTFTSPILNQNKDFTFTLVVNDGEFDSEEVTTTINVELTTGVDDLNPILEQVLLYPNPTKGAFNLSFDENPTDGALVIISNVNGQVFYQERIYEKVKRFNKSLAPGMYLVKIMYQNKVCTRKLLIQ